MPAETSSVPAGSSPVMGANAAALAWLIVEPIVARSLAAISTTAGTTVTCKIDTSQ